MMLAGRRGKAGWAEGHGYVEETRPTPGFSVITGGASKKGRKVGDEDNQEG